MKYLFVFAHPDDETVASGATLRALIDAGEEVFVVTVTDGGAGEVHERAQTRLQKLGSTGALRRQELQDALASLGVRQYRVLNFQDGEITNSLVWGPLREQIVDLIDTYQPDVVITFDHSGWYFHLDHVGVSIATTLAVQQSSHPPLAFFHAHFRVQHSKWKYVYADPVPVTHVVDAAKYIKEKTTALHFHSSQNLHEPLRVVVEDQNHQELYQLVSTTSEGKKVFTNHWLFQAVD